MAGLLLFIFGLVAGVTVSPWLLIVCLVPVAATVTPRGHY